MFKRLYLDNCFTHQNRTFQFSEGLTAITGPNESGKSLILEMIRYALFGSAALRGTASGYKKLHVELDFEIQGTDYRVVRKGSTVKLFEGDDNPIAVGARPVNARILDLLGYDLQVFDIANACCQGKVEALGDMRPADRKRMVDRTIGLTVIDDLIKVVGERANNEQRSADSLAGTVMEPQEPVKPEGYRPSVELEEEYRVLKGLVQERHELIGWLSQPIPDLPPAPETSITETAAELEEYQQRKQTAMRLEAEIAGLRKPTRTLEEIERLEQQLSAYRLWKDYETRRPAYSLDDLERMSFIHDEIERHEIGQRLRKQIEELHSNGTNTCPECGHEWPVEAERLTDLEHELEDLGLGKEVPETPALTPREIMDAVRELERPAPPKAEHPGVDEAELAIARRDLKDGEKREDLIRRLAVYDPGPDRNADLQARRQYEWELENYNRICIIHDAHMSVRDQKQKRADELAGVDEKLVAIDDLMKVCLFYEQDLKHYLTAKDHYDRVQEQVAELRDRADQYFRAREALKELKLKVKGFLVPSLNKVASYLLAQMTDGVRSVVEIDEEFEINIDGQPLNTLSGSAQAVSNVAIRIALGQVLTNKVCSVFAGDEIDASMDVDRAEYTSQCLRNLTKSVRQVFLITHKKPAADNHVIL